VSTAPCGEQRKAWLLGGDTGRSFRPPPPDLPEPGGRSGPIDWLSHGLRAAAGLSLKPRCFGRDRAKAEAVLGWISSNLPSIDRYYAAELIHRKATHTPTCSYGCERSAIRRYRNPDLGGISCAIRSSFLRFHRRSRSARALPQPNHRKGPRAARMENPWHGRHGRNVRQAAPNMAAMNEFMGSMKKMDKAMMSAKGSTRTRLRPQDDRPPPGRHRHGPSRAEARDRRRR
jgi:hypothetical protein